MPSRAAAALLLAQQAAAAKPHIMFLLIDDLGWAELGYQRAEKTKEVQTPNIDALVADGVQLDRHYVHKFCSPTRCAIQSGRAPIHVNVVNADPTFSNPEDPVGGYAGIPRNMTGIAEVMRGAGYKTHFFGKWDVGMATPDHTPAGRGYDSGLIYYHHANDCWTFRDASCNTTELIDHWKWGKTGPFAAPYPGAPATDSVNTAGCTYENQSPAGGGACVYEDALFEEGMKTVIKAHDPADPLFLFWATRTAHGATQPPQAELDKFSFIDVKKRQEYHAMVAWIDGAIGRVVQQWRASLPYNNTLIVFCSDNGGPLPNGNNYPMKGGKFTNWEGGIRVSAFASGGLLPAKVRGTVQTGLVAGWDWYATFAHLAGVDPTDRKAAEAGLPPIDSVNLWPLLTGASAQSPRARVEIGSNTGGDMGNDARHGSGGMGAWGCFDKGRCGRIVGVTMVGGLIVPPHKIVVGGGASEDGSATFLLDFAAWPGPVSPNASSPVDKKAYEAMTESCGVTPETGCLYDVWADPGEHTNLAAAKPNVFKKLLAELLEANQTVYTPLRGRADPKACAKATGDPASGGYGGYWGPFLP